MKALIEIDMGNAEFGNNEAERLFELRQVNERPIDNATHIMAAKAGDYATAQDTNGKQQSQDAHRGGLMKTYKVKLSDGHAEWWEKQRQKT